MSSYPNALPRMPSKTATASSRGAQLDAQLAALKAEEETLQTMLMHLMNRKRQLTIEEERLRTLEEKQEQQKQTSSHMNLENL